MQNKSVFVPKARTENIVVTELKDELLVYCLNTHKAFCLNKTAAAVYQTTDGKKSTSEIAETLSKDFKSPVTEEFVSFALEELKDKDLISFSGVNKISLNTQSRREIIRKIGLATVVALPVITMLVAPKAAHAQSCIADGDSCTPSGAFPFTQDGCCSGLVCCGNGVCGSVCPV